MITTTGGLRITAGLTYPQRSFRPRRDKGVLVAYCWLKLEDGAGFEVFIKSCRLKMDFFGTYFLSLPAEAKVVPCPHCGAQNADHVNYCNWCGGPLKPAGRKGWFMDVIVPSNNETRGLMLQAVLDEHKRNQTKGEFRDVQM